MKHLNTFAGLALALGLSTLAAPAFATCFGCGDNAPRLPSIQVDMTGGTVGAGAVSWSGGTGFGNVEKVSNLKLDAGIYGHTDGCTGGCGTVGGWFTGAAMEQVATQGGVYGHGHEGSVSLGNSSAAAIQLAGGFNRPTFAAVMPGM